jgi:hypothetical protein
MKSSSCDLLLCRILAGLYVLWFHFRFMLVFAGSVGWYIYMFDGFILDPCWCLLLFSLLWCAAQVAAALKREMSLNIK